jgi:hypothetical protein
MLLVYKVMRVLVLVAFLLVSPPLSHAGGCPQLLNDLATIRATRVLAQKIFEEHWGGSKRTVVEDLSAGDRIRITYTGTPNVVTLVENPENIVFCHYRDRKGIQTILATSRIIAGPTPYVNSHHRWLRETYQDMQGIFLTTTDYKPLDVGVADTDKVLIKLPPGTGVLEFEPGIYMIPGKPEELNIPVSIMGWCISGECE